METHKLKEAFILIISLFGVVFFGYSWLSSSYNDKRTNYNYLENNIGQFTFVIFLLFFIYNLLKFIDKDSLFLPSILILLAITVICSIVLKIYLWAVATALLLGILTYSLRKWLTKRSNRSCI